MSDWVIWLCMFFCWVCAVVAYTQKRKAESHAEVAASMMYLAQRQAEKAGRLCEMTEKLMGTIRDLISGGKRNEH